MLFSVPCRPHFYLIGQCEQALHPARDFYHDDGFDGFSPCLSVSSAKSVVKSSEARFSTPPLVFVPQAHPKIAQRFIAGIVANKSVQAPEGRKNPLVCSTLFCRP